MVLFEGFLDLGFFPPKEDKQHKKIKHQIMSGGLLFWMLYYSGLEAFKGGTLCERVLQAFLAGVVVQKIALFEGFGFGIFLPKEDK